MKNSDDINFAQYLPNDLIIKLTREIWSTLTEEHKLNIAQTIVDIFLNVIGIPNNIKISFAEFDNDEINGIFDRNTNQLSLNKHFFISGYKKFSENDIVYYNDANVYFYHIIMHELKHVEQAYLMQYPELNPERANKLMINNTKIKYRYMYIVNSDLYNIQISEREAFKFERVQQKYLSDIASKILSADIVFRDFEFEAHILKENYTSTLQRIKKDYQTNTPFEDLDNIMDAIINNKSYDNLNQIMLQDVLNLTKVKRKFLPFFNQAHEVSIECNEIEYDVESIGCNKCMIIDKNNDWSNGR